MVATFKHIGVPAAEAMLRERDVQVLDVRDAGSYVSGHIAGAQNVSAGTLGQFIDAGRKNVPVLVYCHHGKASEGYAKILTDRGFADVSSLDGGYEAWRHRPAPVTPETAAGDPVLDPDLQRWLTAHGFGANDLNGVTANHTTPLMKASHMGDAAAVRQLIAAGARLDLRNADGGNALWLACVGNHLDIINILVDAGIDIDNRNDNGATCLMYAASSGKPEVVGRLLACGADTTYETLDGFSALDLCSTLECLTLLRQVEKARK